MKLKLLIALGLVLFVPLAYAAETPDPSEEESKDSPWLITPLLSSDPKISTAAGVLAGYVHQFDEESQPSLFGVTGTYSSTDSWYLSAFGKTSFTRDKHRLLAAVVAGEVRNEYSDFLGSGENVKTTDDIVVYAIRYSYRVYGHWYLGPQFFSTNYAITGDDILSGDILGQNDLKGFASNGLGLYAQYDTRDNHYSPSTGRMFEAHSVSYQESLGGDVSFDAFTADYQHFLPYRERDVLALHVRGRWTDDAPISGYSSVDLRGYTRGQYLAPHMTMVEADYRYSLTEKYGVALFAGIAGIYGSDEEKESDELFAAGGAGAFYKLNDEGMVIRADIAVGQEGNYGFYLQFGHGFEK